jgi:hypothetical protein
MTAICKLTPKLATLRSLFSSCQEAESNLRLFLFNGLKYEDIIRYSLMLILLLRNSPKEHYEALIVFLV